MPLNGLMKVLVPHEPGMLAPLRYEAGVAPRRLRQIYSREFHSAFLQARYHTTMRRAMHQRHDTFHRAMTADFRPIFDERLPRRVLASQHATSAAAPPGRAGLYAFVSLPGLRCL